MNWEPHCAGISMCPFGLLTDHGSNEAPFNALGQLQAELVQAFRRGGEQVHGVAAMQRARLQVIRGDDTSPLLLLKALAEGLELMGICGSAFRHNDLQPSGQDFLMLIHGMP